MRQRPYTQQEIIQYLFGRLLPDETGRFDELGFVDNRFIEALNATEIDLIDAYVSGELEGQLLDQFESIYLRSPIKREKVELARALLEHGRRFAPQSAQNQFENSLPSFIGWRWRTGLAAAASIILVVVAWVVLNNARLFPAKEDDQASNQATEDNRNQPAKPQQPQQSPAAKQAPVQMDGPPNAAQSKSETVAPPTKTRIATIVLLPQMRGATDTPAVSIPTSTEYMGIRLELEPNDYSVYKVVLLDRPGGAVLWRSGRLSGQTRDGGKVLELRLPAKIFKSRSYVLRVSGLSENGVEETISDYPFRVVK
ncbi:MAG TPA: hypothetical protein VF074_23065 [Pyrinomonadaceae bacterium]